MTATRELEPGYPGARAGHHPVRRRFGRRDAADGDAVHADRGRLRQRHQHAAGLPGRDPGTGRLAAGRVGLPDQLLVVGHPHPGRPARCPRGDEPGGAQDEHRRPAGGRRVDRQQRRVHAAEPEQGGVRQQPADRRLAQVVHRLRGPDLDPQRAIARRPRHDQQAEGPDQELLRARPDVLAVRARARRARSTGSTRSSRPARSSPRRTSGRSRRATPSARRPRRSTPTIASGPPSSTPASTGTSPATRPRRSASWPPRELADRPLFYGSYPITPASDILHQLSGYKSFGVKTFQAEDEIAAIGAAIGASYGGALGTDRLVGARASRSSRRRWAWPSWSSCRWS